MTADSFSKSNKRQSLDYLKRELEIANRLIADQKEQLKIANQSIKTLTSDLKSLSSRTNSQIQGVFESIIDAYVVMDLNGNIIKMNIPAAQLLGFDTIDESCNLMSMVHSQQTTKVINAYKKLLKTGYLSDFEIPIQTKKNQRKTVHINASIIYDEDLPVAAQGIVRDITIIKENEQREKLINDIVQSIFGKLDIVDISIDITQKIAKYLKTDDCVIYKVNHNNNEVEQIYAIGEKMDKNGSIVNKLTFSLDKGVVGYVAKTGKPQLISDTSSDPRYITDIDCNLSEITVPIIVDDKVIAIIDSEHPEKNHFTNLQLSTLENLSKIVGLKIKDAINRKQTIKARNELIKSEERLRILISSLESGILLEDEYRKIVITNQKFCKMFNIPAAPEEMIGADCVKAADQIKNAFVGPDIFLKRINKILEDKKPVIADEVTMTNGQVFERDYIPLFNKGVYTGHLWNYRDVTFQKTYNKRIEFQRQKYSNIITNMNLGLVELNSDGKVLMVNRSFKDISGYEQSDLLGNNLYRVLFKNTRNQVTHLSQIVDKERLGENLFELEVLNKKQEKRTWLVSETPNYGTDGVQTGYIGIYLDITEQKKLERQKEKLVKDLENSNSELQQYAHIVSHDLKSPLRSIDALVSWLREDNEGNLDENSLKNLSHIQTTLEHMENLISDILNHSGVRKDKLFLENVNVKEIIFDVIGVLNVPKHITVHVEGTLPSIKADKTMLKQLFQNLINNAVKYNNKEQGNVWVNFQEQNNNYLFCIKDDGIGIDKKFHKSIFKIFQSVTKNENSTGIGLAIVKKIVDLHQGEIWVKSELDRGSSFYFTLKK